MSDIVELTPSHGLAVVRTMPQFRAPDRQSTRRQ